MIGIVIPAYNEKENLLSLYEQIQLIIPTAKIIIVDDSKETLELKLKDVEIVHRGQKLGRGSAVLFGISELLKSDINYILEMDADFSHAPEELLAMLHKTEDENLDLLIASRYLPNSQILNWPLSRRVFSKICNHLAAYVLRVPVTDYTNGFRLYSRKAAEEIVKSCGRSGGGFISLSEILVVLYYKNFKISEISSIFKNRMRGESSLSIREILGSAVGLIRIFKMKKHYSRQHQAAHKK